MQRKHSRSHIKNKRKRSPRRTCLFFLQTETLNFPSGVCCITCGVSSRADLARPLTPPEPLSPHPPAAPSVSPPPPELGPNTAPNSVLPRLPQLQPPDLLWPLAAAVGEGVPTAAAGVVAGTTAVEVVSGGGTTARAVVGAAPPPPLLPP